MAHTYCMNGHTLNHSIFQMSRVRCKGCQVEIEGSELECELIEVTAQIFAYSCSECGYRGLQDNFELIRFPLIFDV